MFEIYNERKQFWQWDINQKLIVHDDICSEVHFCNGTSDCAPVCTVYEENGQRLVNVPNILFQTAKSIKVYAYVCGENDQHTEYAQLFAVLPRTKPADYVYTETEVLSYSTLDERLKKIEEDGAGNGTDENAVHYTAEEKTEEEQAQARENIGAASAEQVNELSEEIADKVSLPKNEDGTLNYGTVGYYAVSDGAGGITWVASGNTGGDSDGGETTTTHGIVWDLVNVTSSNPIASVSDGASLTAVLTAADGYTLGDVTVTMGGEVLTGVWNADTATVTIASVTGDVIISCAGVAESTGEVVDTSPVIAQEGYCYRSISSTSPNVTLTANAAFCVTEIYEFTPNVEAIEAHSAYDAENGYITLSNQIYGIKCFNPNDKFLESGGTDVNATYKKGAFFIDGELITDTYINLTNLTSEGYTANAFVNDARAKTVNGIAFTLYSLDKESAYAYWSKNGVDSVVLPLGVNDGDIIFAGKDSPYYGMTNINGVATTSETLSTDDDIAQDYGMSTASILGEEIAENTSSAYGINTEFATVIDEVRTAWMTEYGGDYRKIPLIIHTDQHGRLNASAKGIFNMLGSVLSWHDVSKICNLGDTISVEWYDADTEYPLRTNATLDTAMDTMEAIPFSKRLDVYGNHDTWYGNYEDEGNAIGTRYPATQEFLNQYFRNIYARRTNNNGWFVVKDDVWNVKYVAVSGFEYQNSVEFRIGTNQMDFVIAELSKDDGYDVVIMSHVPIYYAVDTTVYPTNMTDANAEGYMTRVANIDTDALFNARKNKTSGTVTDSDGVEHTFDFSDCTTDILCNFSGHMHIDGYNYVANADDGLLSVTLDKFVDGCIHFILVDRESRLVNIWKVNNPDDTPQYVNYQIPFDKPTE